MQTCLPEEVGLSSERLARIMPAMQKFVDAGQAPGFLIGLARHGKLAFLDSLGWMDIEQRKLIQEDTIFRIYSMSKPIATTALMLLYEEGKVLLQDPVSKYIPSFKDLRVFTGKTENGLQLEALNREITIHNLATHTAGLGYGIFTDSPVEDLFRETGIFRPRVTVMQTSLEEMVNKVAQIPLVNQPGSRWRYSIAIDVIGYLVQLIADQPFDVFLKERIFAPLGMDDTGFYVSEEKLTRFAAMYTPDENKQITLLDGSLNSPFTLPDATPSGGGGLVSTLRDYLNFTQMMLSHGELAGVRILGPKTVEKMSHNHLLPALLPIAMEGISWSGQGFGLGFGINLDESASNLAASTGAYFWGGAASTSFYIDPKEDLALVMMTQVIGNEVPFDQVLRQLVAQAIIGD
jgi:CubicO group peptidase (beta-lactamase class C family)